MEHYSKAYFQNKRSLRQVLELGGDFYKEILKQAKQQGLGRLEDFDFAYEGFEHAPEDPTEKLPNITHIWNLPFSKKGFIYGSSMGHSHPPADFDVQEIYDFFGYGGMLVLQDKNTKLYVCKQGSRILVPPSCMMTILNFSQNNLFTLDMANPQQNQSSKDVVKKKGPMMALYNLGNNDVRIKFNTRYKIFRNNPDIDLTISSSEESLYEQLLNRKNDFEKLNVEVIDVKEKGLLLFLTEGRQSSHRLLRML